MCFILRLKWEETLCPGSGLGQCRLHPSLSHPLGVVLVIRARNRSCSSHSQLLLPFPATAVLERGEGRVGRGKGWVRGERGEGGEERAPCAG